jgi:hypothetical protein
VQDEKGVVDTHLIEGTAVKIYNLAKMICDCFKYRHKIGLDVAVGVLSDGLRTRILPVVLELGLARLKTSAAQTSAEIIDFLLGNPTPDQVIGHHASDRSQERLRRLFTLDGAGLLGGGGASGANRIGAS